MMPGSKRQKSRLKQNARRNPDMTIMLTSLDAMNCFNSTAPEANRFGTFVNSGNSRNRRVALTSVFRLVLTTGFFQKPIVASHSDMGFSLSRARYELITKGDSVMTTSTRPSAGALYMTHPSQKALAFSFHIAHNGSRNERTSEPSIRVRRFETRYSGSLCAETESASYGLFGRVFSISK